MPEVSVVDKTLDGLADDLSSNFHRVKSKLKNDKGETFLEFRKGLTPKYFVVLCRFSQNGRADAPR